MKGLVFREFLTMVENEYGYEMVDSIIENAILPNGGAYTTVGTYPHSEMFALVGELSKKINVDPGNLLFLFGKYIFGVFLKAYPVFFEGKKTSFDLLQEVEGKIHVEVIKLYPEAELPSFTVNEESENVMTMYYESSRKMADFAVGLINACIDHFNEKAQVEKLKEEQGGEKVLIRIRILNE